MRTLLIALVASAAALPVAAIAAPATPAPAPAGYHAGEAFEMAFYRHNGRRHTRRVWRGRDGRYRCRRDDGTEGLVIGALAGGVVGHEVAGENDETEGAIIGAIAGGLVGREIDRDDVDCR